MVSRCVLPLLAVLLLAGCSAPDNLLRAMAYGEIADARFRAGDPAGAHDSARLAIKAAESADNGEERMFAELAASVALLRAGYPGDAMRRAEALPDPEARLVAFAGLARALATYGLSYEAGQAVAATTGLMATVPQEEEEHYRAVALLARSATGDFSEALGKAAAIGDSDIRSGLLAIIAEDQAASGDFAGALSTAALIGDNPEMAESEFYLVGRILEAIGGDSIAVARELLFDARVPPRIVALNRIAFQQARQADFPGAVETLAAARTYAEEYNNGVLRAQALVSVAMTRAVVGDEAGALEVLARADALLSGQLGEGRWEADRARTIALAVRDAIENGKASEDAVGRIDFTGDPNELLIMKAVALVRLSRTGAALETLDFAVRSSRRDSDLSPTALGYAILADRQAVLGDLPAAQNSAQNALSIAERLSPSSEDMAIAMYFATVALIRAGQLGLAQETAARIELKRPEAVQQ